MTNEAPEPVKSTQQLDLEARADDDYVSPLARAKTVGPNESLVSEDGFVGVDPIYQNYANDTEAPYQSDEGVEKDLEDRAMNAAEEDTKQSEELQAQADEVQSEAPKQTEPEPAATPATDQ